MIDHEAHFKPWRVCGPHRTQALFGACQLSRLICLIRHLDTSFRFPRVSMDSKGRLPLTPISRVPGVGRRRIFPADAGQIVDGLILDISLLGKRRRLVSPRVRLKRAHGCSMKAS